MVIHESLKGALKLKAVLLDTCVLGTIRNNIKNPDVQDFLKLLDELKCTLTINDLIKAEFFRDANSHTELLERNNFIKALCQQFSLPFDQSIYRSAMILSYIYVRHKHKGVELIDLMTSALLEKYANNQRLILVTTNHKDYPLTVHDRIGAVVLDLGKDLSTLGFYTINTNKWAEEASELRDSEEWQPPARSNIPEPPKLFG
ncbi:MAG: hypothetical protein AAB588_06310 [Patescibacteria group bacterium]